MISVTAKFLAAIRAPHRLAATVDAYPPDGSGPISLPINGGSVTLDRTADHRSRLDVNVSDPSMYPSSTSSPLSVYGTELVAKRGVLYPDGTSDLVQLGVFRVEEETRDTPGGDVAVTAWGRSMQVADQRFIAPRVFVAQTAVTLIELLVSEVYPSMVFHDLSGDTTTIPKHTVDRDRWAEVQRVARVIGCEVFFDGAGDCVIRPVPDPTTATSVWDVDAGPTGVLVKTTDAVSRTGAPNGVVAIGEPKDGTAPVHALASDDNTASPTYWGGAYGKVPRFYSSPLIRTSTQAGRVAQAMLNDHLGLTRTISFDSAPNPALEPGDTVLVTRADGSTELHMIDVLQIPLDAATAMTGETRATDWQAE